MTWWILLAMAGFLTWLSFRQYNLLFSFCASLLWFAVWGNHLNNPPAGVAVGSFVFNLLFYTFLLMANAVMLLYFRNRGRMSSGQTRTAVEQANYEKEYNEAKNAPSDDTEEYRQRVRKALRPRRRR